jgi:hypothetical protein
MILIQGIKEFQTYSRYCNMKAMCEAVCMMECVKEGVFHCLWLSEDEFVAVCIGGYTCMFMHLGVQACVHIWCSVCVCGAHGYI